MPVTCTGGARGLAGAMPPPNITANILYVIYNFIIYIRKYIIKALSYIFLMTFGQQNHTNLYFIFG
jgi:hypothetical protein